MRIPAHLWQTYRTAVPPPRARDCMASWRRFNPGLSCHYFDDHACSDFMRNWFNPVVVDMYESLPIGVMKADVWRVAVVYVYGGIYADIDTECRAAVSEWIGADHSLVVAVENETGAIGNFAFAATAQHPALRNVLRTFLKLHRSKQFMDPSSPTPVQDFGAGGWSLGVLQYYGMSSETIRRSGGDQDCRSPQAIADRAMFYPAASQLITPYCAPHTKVFHQTASVFWTENYCQWRSDQSRFLQAAADRAP